MDAGQNTYFGGLKKCPVISTPKEKYWQWMNLILPVADLLKSLLRGTSKWSLGIAYRIDWQITKVQRMACKFYLVDRNKVEMMVYSTCLDDHRSMKFAVFGGVMKLGKADVLVMPYSYTKMLMVAIEDEYNWDVQRVGDPYHPPIK